MNDQLTVDLDGLTDLVRQLRRVTEYFSSNQVRLGGQDDAIGDRRVDAALDEFDRCWLEGRRTITEDLGGLAKLLEQAVREYRAADEALANQVNGGSRPVCTPAGGPKPHLQSAGPVR